MHLQLLQSEVLKGDLSVLGKQKHGRLEREVTSGKEALYVAKPTEELIRESQYQKRLKNRQGDERGTCKAAIVVLKRALICSSMIHSQE